MKKMKCPLQSVRAVLLLALLVVVSLAGTAYGKYVGKVTLPEKLSLSVKSNINYRLPVGMDGSKYDFAHDAMLTPFRTAGGQHLDLVFGYYETYEDVVQGFTSVGIAVDENDRHTDAVKDKIKVYYSSSSTTVYILSEDIIYANPDSACMFRQKRNSSIANDNDPVYNSIRFENFNTSKVQTMDGMFSYNTGSNGHKMTYLDLRSWDVSNVKDMSDMFNCMRNLEVIDLRGWNVSNVTDMSYMFSICPKLKHIIVDEFDVSNVTNSAGMFGATHYDMYYLNNLVGGAGTKWSVDNPTDKTYARIDGGPDSDTPGYFTSAEQYANPVSSAPAQARANLNFAGRGIDVSQISPAA